MLLWCCLPLACPVCSLCLSLRCPQLASSPYTLGDAPCLCARYNSAQPMWLTNRMYHLPLGPPAQCARKPVDSFGHFRSVWATQAGTQLWLLIRAGHVELSLSQPFWLAGSSRLARIVCAERRCNALYRQSKTSLAVCRASTRSEYNELCCCIAAAAVFCRCTMRHTGRPAWEVWLRCLCTVQCRLSKG